MNIIVTGGAGFIGSNFVFHMLNKYPDYRIICLDKLTYAGNLSTLEPVMDNPNFRFVKADICDREAVNKLFEEEHPDVVVNFAAESHVDRSIERDGKVNSIVKIVRAESASMKTGEVSQEDRMEVMLNSIMSEIKEIRNTTDRKSYLKNYETTVSTIHPENFTFNFEEPTNLDKSKNIWKREKFLVELKKSITREEVNDALNRMINKGINIGYNLNGNELVVEVVDSYLKINKVMVKEILEDLGEVKTL